MVDARETIRFNVNNPRDKELYLYLNNVQGRRRGAFIKEAMEFYIDAIKKGYYDCPYLKPEFEKNRFEDILKEVHKPKEEQLSINTNDFTKSLEEIEKQVMKEHNININEQYQAIQNDTQNNNFKNSFIERHKEELILDKDELGEF